MKLTVKTSVELPAPFKAAELRAFINALPDEGRVSVTTRMGGHQRDPYPTGYLVQATWETES